MIIIFQLTSSLVVEVDFLEIIKGISSIAGKREQYISDNEVAITEKTTQKRLL